MLASTYFFVAAPLSPESPSPVMRPIETPPIVARAAALAVKIAGVLLLIVMVQVATFPEKATAAPQVVL
jgi:hypothetical protein